MRNIIQNHVEMVSCIICGDPITVGTVPAVCSERCRAKYEYLIELEKEDKEDDYTETAQGGVA